MAVSIDIAGRAVGNGLKPFIIAEVGQAHEGSLGLAHKFIDAAADAGADAVKFQTHIASEESTLDEPFRVKFSEQDDTRFAYWRRMEFSAEQWAGLSKHAKDRGIVFLSSAFSVAAVELLNALDMPAWKVGSGEFWSSTLIEAMVETGKPVLVSTGMASWAEIEAIAAGMAENDHPFALLQCTSRYPTDLADVGLNVVERMIHDIGCVSGLSDHSGQVFPALAAMARGAAIIEVHITLSRYMFGPDIAASLTPDELKLLADARDAFSKMDANPVEKDVYAGEMAPMKALFSKSVALKQALPAGTVLDRAHLCAKKPGTGIPWGQVNELVGKRAKTDLNEDRLLKWEDVE